MFFYDEGHEEPRRQGGNAVGLVVSLRLGVWYFVRNAVYLRMGIAFDLPRDAFLRNASPTDYCPLTTP